MKYCAFDNFGRLANHLFVNDGKEREKIVAAHRGQYPYMIDRFQDAETFSFQLIGDTGEGDNSQLVMASDFTKMPQRYPDTRFAIILGDIVYPDGDDSDYEKRFFIPYRDYPKPIIGVVGNHDWYSKLRGYQKHFLSESALAQQYQRPQVVQPNLYFFIETKRLRIICLDSGISGDRIDDEQMQWLREVCQRDPADITKILLLHHPLYAEDERRKIAGQLESLVNQYRIKLTFGAHIHNYQKYTITDVATGHQTVHLVNGGGGAGLSPTHPLADKKLVEDFYPSVADSNKKFPKILGLFRPPSWITNCKDEYPHYKSFCNVSVKPAGLEITIFKKKGDQDPLEETTFRLT